MLSIGKINGVDGSTGSYYIDAVASGQEDYYTGAGEAPGQWIGSGTELFEISGEVTPEAFRHMLNGRDPVTGRGLRRRAPRDELTGDLAPGVVRAYDLTWSVPKSVSVLYAGGDDALAAEINDALDAATAAGVGWMERNACVVGRGVSSREAHLADGFVAAAFRHRTSREGDPQLHTHVVVSNMARGRDGRWTALRSRWLFHSARTAGFVFQAELRRELTQRLGVQWRAAGIPGVYEIDGVPAEIMRSMSKRRVQIENALAERAAAGEVASGKRVAGVVALDTRPAKDHTLDNAPGLRESWRAVLGEMGFDAEAIAAVLAAPREATIDPAVVAALGERLAGAHGLTLHESHFRSHDVLRAWAEAAVDGASVGELEALTEAWLAGPQTVALPEDVTLADGGGEVGGEAVAAARPDPLRAARRRYTTRDLLAVERQLLADAHAGRGRGAGTCSREVVEKVLAGSPTASPEQRAMVRALAERGDRLAVVRAPAGAGKTFTLDLARQAWQGEGYRVLGVALSRRAAAEMAEQAHLDYSTSIARFWIDLNRDGGLPRNAVVIVDEAAMVGTRDIAALLQVVDDVDGKLVLVGDERQVPEIHAGGAFRALAQRGDAIELTDNFRQKDPLERERVLALRHGAAGAFLETGLRTGRVVLGSNPKETRDLLLADWLHDRELTRPGQAIMLARTNADVSWLNDAARAVLRDRGDLAGADLVVADRAFAVGDLVVARRNVGRLDLSNGTRGQIVAVDAGGETVTMRTFEDKPRDITLGADYLRRRHLHHGYALTANLAQGMTVERVRALGGEAGYTAEWSYSALTRHKTSAFFYLTAPDAMRLGRLPSREDPLRTIVRTLGQRAAKSLALDTLGSTDALAQTPDAELRDRRAALVALLRTYPANAAHQRAWHERQLTAAERELTKAEQRVGVLDAQLETAPAAQAPGLQRDRERAQRSADAWRREADEHRRELAALPERLSPETWLRRNAPAIHELAQVERELSQRSERALRARIAAALVEPDADLGALVGGRPLARADALAWDAAVRAVEIYRHHEPPGLPAAGGGVLGPRPSERAHQERWDAATAALSGYLERDRRPGLPDLGDD